MTAVYTEEFWSDKLTKLRNEYKITDLKVAPTKPATKKTKILFYTLLVMGAIGAICEGFDGITSILGLLPGIPILAVFVGGLVFALLSILVFYGVDRIQMAKNLDYPLPEELNPVLDTAIELVDLIEKKDHKNYKLDDLKNLLKVLEDNMNRPGVKRVTVALSAITGVLFFSSGFFTGQSLPLLIGKLAGHSLAISSPIVLAVSIVVGLAALMCYWYFERSGIELFVDKCFKIPREKIGFFKEKLSKLEEECQESNTP